MPECPACKKPFEEKNKGQHYCSNKCKYKARRTIPSFNCKTCGKLIRKPRTKTQIYCSAICKTNSFKVPPPPVEVLVEAMLKHRYKDRPNWTTLEKALGSDIKTVKRWAKDLKLVDENNFGPIVNGEHLPTTYGEPRPVRLHLTSKEYLTERLFRKREIDSLTDCWVWIGSWNQKGYGYLRLPRPYSRKHFLVHEVAAHIWLNKNLICHQFVFHTCGVRACFNPDHFKICRNRKSLSKLCGKYKRQPRGEKNGRAIISLATALNVRDAIICGGETNKQIADRLCINNHIVYQIAHRITWKHIWKMQSV